MTDRLSARVLAETLITQFEAWGAKRIDPPILLDAAKLLDLYGEDMRARAYLTADPLRGERILRPDFTLPVVQAHLAAEAGQPARYTYAGEVFRKQEDESERPSEYIQAGVEYLGMAAPLQAEAEIFARVHDAVSGLGLRAAIGDISLLRSAVAGLDTSERRRGALLRHIWRPKRFRVLLERFAGRQPAPIDRQRLIDDPPAIPDTIPGKRSAAEVRARLDWLIEDRTTPPLSGEVLALFDHLLRIKETAPNALEQLSDLALDLPAIAPAVARMEERLDALTAQGIDINALEFEGSYGRTTLEYYDGFVFGFYAPGRPDLPPFASGGRYDHLVQALGATRPVAAFGAVLRPELMLAQQQGVLT